MPTALPSETKVVIVGGGIVGCSIAYHLTRLGWKDVVLLEQNQLAGGTTWHAAGLVGRLRTTNSMTRINQYSAQLYASLEKETGHPVGWKRVGSLIVGRSRERMNQLQRTAAMAEWFGVEVQLLSPEAALEKWPLLRVDDVLGAAWLPHDGKLVPKEVTLALAKASRQRDFLGHQLAIVRQPGGKLVPKEVTLALAKASRQRGAKIFENVRVLEVQHEKGHVTGVKTNQGPIRAESVVLAGGM